MIVFMVCRFLNASRFLEIRRIAYESYCPMLKFSVNQSEHAFCAAVRSARCKGIRFAQVDAAPGEVLLWISQGKSNHDIGVILGAKTGTICKHVEHIFAKLNVENRTAAAVIALETCRSGVAAPESKLAQPWAAIVGFITTQLWALCSDGYELCNEIGRLFA
jgi:DNA-binding CsgD family transcriptional regulator